MRPSARQALEAAGKRLGKGSVSNPEGDLVFLLKVEELGAFLARW